MFNTKDNLLLNQEKIFIGFSNSVHDPAIAIINHEGELLFAEGLERRLKNKRAWNASVDSIGVIEPLLKKYAQNKQVVAATSWSANSLRMAPVVSKLLKVQKQYIKLFSSDKERLGRMYENQLFQQSMYRVPSNLNNLLLNLEYRLAEFGNPAPIKLSYNHHLCHAATACHTSNFDDAMCLVFDGLGESGSMAAYHYKNKTIQPLKKSGKLNFASIGLFYQAACKACMFDPLSGEEWKLMGMASYGKFSQEYYNLLRPMLYVKGGILYRSRDYYKRLSSLLLLSEGFTASMDGKDLAFTVQYITEELTGELLHQLYDEYGTDQLILTGGCALNSSSNGKILTNTPFKALHIPMSPGDDGNAIGAAALAWQTYNSSGNLRINGTPYLGSEIIESDIKRFTQFSNINSYTCSNQEELTDKVSEALIAGNIIGWIQGKAEFGPRALGNRSILADCRNKSIKQILNDRVKFREEFRPFAPIILHEKGEAYFNNYSYTPYMEKTLVFSNLEDTPGVVHEDNTGRVQSVTETNNPLFYNLLKDYYKKTQVPILLNTSFNVMGRPIVHDMEDAFGVFMGSGLDILVVGNTIFNKNDVA